MSFRQTFTDLPVRPIHPDWNRLWVSDLKDQTLKNEICTNPRFQDRLRVDLLKYVEKANVPDTITYSQKVGLANVLSYPQDRMLRQLGFLWLAPILGKRVFNPQHREAVGITDREELHAIMRYQSHAAAAAVDPFDVVPDYVEQGLLCLLAWFSQFSLPVRCSLIFEYPQVPFEDAEVVSARALFATGVFSDDTLRWVEVQ